MSREGTSSRGPRPRPPEAASRGPDDRAAVPILVQLQVSLGGHGEGFSVCNTVNLSASGALLATRRPAPVGTELRFELLLPDDPLPIRGSCVVVRHAEAGREDVTGMAVRFESFVDHDEDRLAGLLDSLVGRHDDALP